VEGIKTALRCDPNPAAALRPPLVALGLGSFAPEGSKQLAADHPPHFPVRFHSSSPDSNSVLVFGDRSEMAVPLLTTKIVKKRTKHFKRAHSDRYIGLKVTNLFCEHSLWWKLPVPHVLVVPYGRFDLVLDRDCYALL
jgi:hypothetical protein